MTEAQAALLDELEAYLGSSEFADMVSVLDSFSVQRSAPDTLQVAPGDIVVRPLPEGEGPDITPRLLLESPAVPSYADATVQGLGMAVFAVLSASRTNA